MYLHLQISCCDSHRVPTHLEVQNSRSFQVFIWFQERFFKWIANVLRHYDTKYSTIILILPLILPKMVSLVEWNNSSSTGHLGMHHYCIGRGGNVPEIKLWHNHRKWFLWRCLGNFFSSKLYAETRYVLQLLKVSPIAQLVVHQNTVIKAFIVCTKYNSSIF